MLRHGRYFLTSVNLPHGIHYHAYFQPCAPLIETADYYSPPFFTVGAIILVKQSPISSLSKRRKRHDTDSPLRYLLARKIVAFRRSATICRKLLLLLSSSYGPGRHLLATARGLATAAPIDISAMAAQAAAYYGSDADSHYL